jgi:Sir2 family
MSRFVGHDVVVDVVTQNVDDLHERAGVKGVQHLHGCRLRCAAATAGNPASEFSSVLSVNPVARLAFISVALLGMMKDTASSCFSRL